MNLQQVLQRRVNILIFDDWRFIIHANVTVIRQISGGL